MNTILTNFAKLYLQFESSSALLIQNIVLFSLIFKEVRIKWSLGETGAGREREGEGEGGRG